MNDCCESPVADAGARACATCAERGSPVQLQTVKALLTEVALRRLQLTHYRFCANAACETVYFGDAGDQFGTGDIRVPVWQKRPATGSSCVTASAKPSPAFGESSWSMGAQKSLPGSVSTSPRSVAPVTFGTPGVRAAWVM